MPLILHFILGFVWWGVAFPIVWLAATPVVLFLSLFGDGKYWEKVCERYKGVTDFWKEHGILFVP